VPQRHERIRKEVIIDHEIASSNDRLGLKPASSNASPFPPELFACFAGAAA
jgi:hypothetical protein